MSRRKITEDIHLLWQRHDNAEATIEKLQEWTTDRPMILLKPVLI